MINKLKSAAQQLNHWIDSTPDKTLLTIIHDRKCCDAMGAVMGFAHIAKRFKKNVSCIFARPHSQPMSERLYTELIVPKGILLSGEKIEDKLEKKLQNHSAIFALDTSSTQNCTYLPIILSKKPLKLYCIDHHEAGFEDVSVIPNSEIIRIEEAQAASTIMTLILNENNTLPEDQATLIALYMGIYQDTIMIPQSQYSSLTKQANLLLEELLSPRSQHYIEQLKNTPYPLDWQYLLEKTLTTPVKHQCLVTGLGIIDNPGVVPYIADNILSAKNATTSIVIALSEEKVSKKVYLDLVASGRSKDNHAEHLPMLFGTVFTTVINGKLVSKGGGKMTGNLASCAACIPLSVSSDAQQLWHSEILKIKETLIAYGIPNECITWKDYPLNL